MPSIVTPPCQPQVASSSDTAASNSLPVPAKQKTQVPQSLSLGELLKKKASESAVERRGNIEDPKDALDAAILFGTEAMRQDVPEVQKLLKSKASDALALALFSEARDVGIETVPSSLLKATEVAQGALDFTFLTQAHLAIDAHNLDELRVRAEDAIQVGLNAMQRADLSAEEPLGTHFQESTLECLEQVLCIASDVLRGRLREQALVDARQKARDAVASAVDCEVTCSCIQLSPEELQHAVRRACLALDSVTLVDPDMCASSKLSLVKGKALNTLHLALLGVKIC